ncbi:MAG: TIM barrel protein [Candidatus Latescibacterota bacterium]
MSASRVEYAVFTKPWKTMPLPELGCFVSSMGFQAVELPVRPVFQVEPQAVAAGLPRAARELAQSGVRIASIAGPTDEATMAACAEAGVPIIRICVSIPQDEGYMEAEARLQREYDALVPLLDRHGVTLGIQNHCDRCVANAMGIRHLIEKYDPRHVAAVWDAAHNALNGEDPELAIDIVWSHLCMVNLKNAFWRRTSGPEAEDVTWRPYWTTGRQGLASWPRVAAELQRRQWSGVLCLTAEYSAEKSVDRLTREDLAFARSLFG